MIYPFISDVSARVKCCILNIVFLFPVVSPGDPLVTPLGPGKDECKSRSSFNLQNCSPLASDINVPCHDFRNGSLDRSGSFI